MPVKNQLEELTDLTREFYDFTRESWDVGYNQHYTEVPLFEETVETFFPTLTTGELIDLSWVPASFPEFCRKFLSLSAGASGLALTRFNPFDFQLAIAESFQTHVLTGVYKSRQQGISEIAIAYILWRMLGAGKEEKGFSALIYSLSQNDAKLLGDRMLNMLSGIESELPPFVIDSQTHRRFAGGYGDIKFLATNKGRGMTGIDFVVIDEIEFIPEIDTLLAGIKPALSRSGGHLAYLSTPNGVGGELYKLIQSVNLPAFDQVTEMYRSLPKDEPGARFWHHFSDGQKCFFTVHWKANPFCTEEWATQYRLSQNIPDYIWNTEFEISPNAGGTRIFSQEWIDNCKKEIPTAGLLCEIVGVDTNAGTMGNDYTALIPIQKKVGSHSFIVRNGVYDNKLEHPEQIELITKTLFEFHPIRVVIEGNNAGQIFYTSLRGAYPIGDNMDTFYTTQKTKEAAIQTLAYMLQSGLLTIEEGHPLYDELPVYQMWVKNNVRKYSAKASHHDDAIMALAIALYKLVSDENYGSVTLEQIQRPIVNEVGSERKRTSRRLLNLGIKV